MTGQRRRVYLVVGIAAAGCALLLASRAVTSRGSATYPIVTDPPPAYTPPITTANGAIVQFPVDPTVEIQRPSRITVRQAGTERLVARIEEADDGSLTVKVAPNVKIETLPVGALLTRE